MTVDHISFSSLKTFIKCPRLFCAEKILKIEPFFGNEHTITGSGVHKGFEHYFEFHKQHKGTVYKIIQNVAREEILQEAGRIREKGYPLTDDMLKQALQASDMIVKNCLPRFVYYLGSRFKVLNTELEIKYPLSEICDSDLVFEAHIDLVTQRLPNEIMLWDYKTSKGMWGGDKKNDLEQVKSQLLLYKYFYCKKFNVPPKDVKTFFVIMGKHAPYALECWPVTYTIGDLNIMLSHIKDCAQAIKNNEFECRGLEHNCVDFVNKNGVEYHCKHFDESSSTCKICY